MTAFIGGGRQLLILADNLRRQLLSPIVEGIFDCQPVDAINWLQVSLRGVPSGCWYQTLADPQNQHTFG